MFQGVSKGLKKVDIFGQTITLNMNKRGYYTTSFGGFSSILIICLVSTIFFSNIIAFFTMQNVSHENEVIFSNDPASIELNSKNSMFAFSISQNNFLSNPYFNITFEQKIYQRESNGGMRKITQEIPLRPCLIEDFNNIFQKEGIDFQDQFQLLGMGNMLCPQQDFVSIIEGTYSSEVFQFLRVSVKDCNQEESYINGFWNPQCATDEERASFLSENGQFKLQIIQINTVINPQNPSNYKTIFIDTDMYFSFVPKKLARIANIFYREIQILNDQSILPYENNDKENIIMRKAEDYRDLTELGRDSDDNYAIIYMRRSSFTEIIKRKYQKLGELLSFLGGFMQIMKFIFGYVITFYNKTSMLIELANKLYDFKDESDVRKPRHINTVTYQGQKYQQDMFTTDQQLQANSLGTSNEFSNLEWKDCIKKLVQKSKPISFNIKLLLNRLTNGLILNNKNAQFFAKAMEKINGELDLHSVFYQLQEINKIKQVLLRKSQIILFNFSPKPLITLGKNYITPSRLTLEHEKSILLNYQDNELNQELFGKLQRAYKEIVEDMQKHPSNLCQLNINLKLTKLMGQDLQKLFVQPLQRRNGCLMLDTNGQQDLESA